ncbi:MAG: prepilin-type N-terminal cleavage/methylation domain-containing protein [Desulfobacteraceae bacterium]
MEVEMVLESITGRLDMIFRKSIPGMPSADDKGFTLLEVVIAISLFLVVALALTSLSVGTWYSTHSSKSSTEGSIVAAQYLEELISRKFVSEKLEGMSYKLTAGKHTFTTDDGRYTGTYRIKDNDILPGTKTVQITVNYNTHGSKARRVRYNYLLPLRK